MTAASAIAAAVESYRTANESSSVVEAQWDATPPAIRSAIGRRVAAQMGREWGRDLDTFNRFLSFVEAESEREAIATPIPTVADPAPAPKAAPVAPSLDGIEVHKNKLGHGGVVRFTTKPFAASVRGELMVDKRGRTRTFTTRAAATKAAVAARDAVAGVVPAEAVDATQEKATPSPAPIIDVAPVAVESTPVANPWADRPFALRSAARLDQMDWAWSRRQAAVADILGRNPLEAEPAPPVARVVAIRGREYAVREIAIDKSIGSQAFEVTALSGRTHYHVHRDTFGGVHCDCADHEFRRSHANGFGSPCKHVHRLIGLGMLMAPSPGVIPPFPSPGRQPNRGRSARRVADAWADSPGWVDGPLGYRLA